MDRKDQPEERLPLCDVITHRPLFSDLVNAKGKPSSAN